MKMSTLSINKCSLVSGGVGGGGGDDLDPKQKLEPGTFTNGNGWEPRYKDSFELTPLTNGFGIDPA